MKYFLMMVLIGFAASSASVGLASSQGPLSAKRLLAWCQSNDDELKAKCAGFLIAVEYDSRATLTGTTAGACVPKNTPHDEVQELVILVLKSLDDRQHDDAAVLTMEALVSAFPCPFDTRISTR